MKRETTVKVLTIALLALGTTFVSCDRKKSSKKTTNTTAIAEEINTIPTYRESIVFITGKDNENSSFYKNAKTYFEEKEFEVITDAFSLQEIILWLNNNFDERLYTDIHIVTKNNPWKGMALETTIEGEKITEQTLREDLVHGKIPKLDKVITEDTNIIFHASSLNDNAELIRTFKNAFTSNVSANIITTPFYNIFGGEFSSHNLAKPYYGFYPTAKSPGKTDLSKEFAKKYPNEKEIDWYTALNNENERFVGDAYTIQFNFPVQWEFEYNGEEEVPYFENTKEIIEWIKEDEEISKQLATYNIPIEKFRWNSKTTKDKLVIKGITTVLCVLKPLIKPYGDLQHIEPEIDNLRLYTVE